MRIWIDTDIGTDVDDALTLAYVLRHPGFELVGISTVFGDVGLRSRIAADLLSKSGTTSQNSVDGDVPVITGLGVPLAADRDGRMFGHEGRGLLDDAAPIARVEHESDADARVEVLAKSIDTAAPDVLLAIGPLTNLGALARVGFSLPPLAIMGGKLQDVMLPGMIPQISEWNWFCDPLAVQVVIGASHATLPSVVPAEVTFQTRLAEGDVELLAEGDELTRALAGLSAIWLDVQREAGSKQPTVALHDPLTAAVLVEAGLCNFADRSIAVDDAGATSAGAGAPNVRAALDVDANALRNHLMETWLA
jgi:purine nucleosidase